MMWGYAFAWPMMLWMILSGALWIVLLAVLIWALVRWLNRKTMTPPPYEGRHETTMQPGGALCTGNSPTTLRTWRD